MTPRKIFLLPSLYGKRIADSCCVSLLGGAFRDLAVLGRLADYKYYNMDDAIDRALNLFEARYAA